MCRTPELVERTNTSYSSAGHNVTVWWCVNCDRNAHTCPVCDQLRCDSDLYMSIMGQIPLACKVCQPAGIRSWMGPGDVPGTVQFGWVPEGQPAPWET